VIEVLQSTHPLVAFLVCGLATAIAAIAVGVNRATNHMRVAELSKVANAYQELNSALEHLPDDDTYMSEEMRDFINSYVDRLDDPEFFDLYADELRKFLDAKPQRREAPPFAEELDKLQKTRPELVRNFETFVRSISFIFAYRHEAPAKKVRKKMIELLLRDQEDTNLRVLGSVEQNSEFDRRSEALA